MDASWLPATDAATPASELRYQLYVSPDPAFTPSASTLKAEGVAMLSAHVVGLDPATPYTVILKVSNAAGLSATSAPLTATTWALNTTVRPGVAVAQPRDSQILEVTDNTVTLSADATPPKVGQFIASTLNDGFLRRVTNISQVAGKLSVQTIPAALNEVVSEAKISSSISLANVPVALSADHNRVTAKQLQKRNNATQWHWGETNFKLTSAQPFTDAAAQKEGANIRASSTPVSPKETKTLEFKGDFSISNEITFLYDPILSIDADISLGGLRQASLITSGRAELAQKLTITANGSGSIDAKQPLISARSFTKIFPGTPPVVLSGEFQADLHITGTVSGSLNAVEEVNFSLEDILIGAVYQNGAWVEQRAARPTYSLLIRGNGDAVAHLNIALEPRITTKIYHSLAGRLVVVPSIRADAGIHGDVQFSAGAVPPAPDADYWLTEGKISGAIDAYMLADFSMMDRAWLSIPSGANIDDYSTYWHLPIFANTEILGIPQLTATVDYTAVHPDNSQAILIKGRASAIPNPLQSLFGGPNEFISFDQWTAPMVLGLTADEYKVVPSPAGATPGDLWVEILKAGTYKLRLGGYSSLGTWARQIVEVDVEGRQYPEVFIDNVSVDFAYTADFFGTSIDWYAVSIHGRARSSVNYGALYPSISPSLGWSSTDRTTIPTLTCSTWTLYPETPEINACVRADGNPEWTDFVHTSLLTKDFINTYDIVPYVGIFSFRLYCGNDPRYCPIIKGAPF